MMLVAACREERWVVMRPFRRSYGDMVTMARPGGVRGPRTGLRIFLAGAAIVVPWGLFAMALLSSSVTGHRDTSFVVISLIYAVGTAPLAVCLLRPEKHGTGYAWFEDDNGCSGPGT